MTNPFSDATGRVGLAAALSSALLAVLLVLAGLSSPAIAHEVQPSVMDITLGQRTAITLDASIEPFIAGVDLEGLEDTNASDRSAAVDALRALAPEDLARRMRDEFAALADDFTLTVDGEVAELRLDDVAVPEIGNADLPRMSTLSLSADLPGDGPVVVNWAPSLGALVIRQQGVDEGAFTAFLSSGGQSDPIPWAGGAGQSRTAAFFDYLLVGFEHIVPLGLDHILFVLGLFFLSQRLGPLLWQVTAFTAAHTVTLALAATGVVSIPGSVVEPLIAATIVYVAVENILSRGMTRWRPALVLVFGLLHGLGFAGVLTEYGLAAQNFVPKLIGFNVGVEIGQIAVIAVAFGLSFAATRARGPNRPLAAMHLGAAVLLVPLLAAVPLLLGFEGGFLPVAATVGVILALTGAALAEGGEDLYARSVARPASALIALVGAYWVIERTLL